CAARIAAFLLPHVKATKLNAREARHFAGSIPRLWFFLACIDFLFELILNTVVLKQRKPKSVVVPIHVRPYPEPERSRPRAWPHVSVSRCSCFFPAGVKVVASRSSAMFENPPFAAINPGCSNR